MNWFELKAWWIYRREAKGRHGVHSPFVYRLVDEALRPNSGHFREVAAYKSDNGRLFRPDDLQRRLICHFRFREIILPDGADGHMNIFHRREAPGSAQRRLLDWQGLPPQLWTLQPDATPALPNAEDVVMVHGIHASPERDAAWRSLCRHPSVRLSIDLFKAGLLFFSEDFKERQHFVLKFH